MILKIQLSPGRASDYLTAAEEWRKVARDSAPAAALRRGMTVLGTAAAGLVLLATGTSDAPLVPRQAPPKARLIPDPRAVKLQSFFDRYNCPSPHHVMEYLLAADRYGLDYRLLPAVSLRETHCGIEEKENNRWGYHPGRQSFPSVVQGIDYVARQLAENPYYRGKTLQEKLLMYNPRPAYAGEVEWIMRQIQ